ncbi:MAG: quinone oxidoreductase [Alphaproteobacteria bacterium]|nr:quinone oxidoreductase [Alphaproteobacteria bacterium]MCY4318736.1 quinone oxidoreductase [Alphaproteobacteria bacterium]
MQVKAIRIDRPGPPSAMELRIVTVGEPGPGEALIRHTAIGLNYIDTYHRSGLYDLPMPSGIGSEAAGVVEAVGEGVKHVRSGDRAAYAGGAPGSYSEARIMPADRLVKLPDDIDDRQAAAMMLKGMTVEYLLNRTFEVTSDQTILFHAAAGGVGLIAGQWAKALGATVIGTAGGPEKCALAKGYGYDHMIDYKQGGIAQQVRELTGGTGVPVVYDSVGKATWEESLDCLTPRGVMVSFGNASGPAAPFAPGILAAKGSLYLTRPSLVHYTLTQQEVQASAEALFAMVGSGKVRIEVNQTYTLADAARAHEDLEGRRTTGSTVLLVE